MTIKHYTAKGLTGLSLALVIDGVCRRIEFCRGHRVGSVVKCAYYTTSDKGEQDAIESLAFPIITLEYAKDVAEKPSDARQEAAPMETRRFEDVKTMKDAVAVFTEEYGLKAVQCNTKAKIQKKMAELNVAFPNITYDI